MKVIIEMTAVELINKLGEARKRLKQRNKKIRFCFILLSLLADSFIKLLASHIQ